MLMEERNEISILTTVEAIKFIPTIHMSRKATTEKDKGHTKPTRLEEITVIKKSQPCKTQIQPAEVFILSKSRRGKQLESETW